MRITKIKDIPLNKKVRIGGTIGNRWTSKAVGVFIKEGEKTIFYNDDNFSYCIEEALKVKDVLIIGIEEIKGD